MSFVCAYSRGKINGKKLISYSHWRSFGLISGWTIYWIRSWTWNNFIFWFFSFFLMKRKCWTAFSAQIWLRVVIERTRASALLIWSKWSLFGTDLHSWCTRLNKLQCTYFIMLRPWYRSVSFAIIRKFFRLRKYALSCIFTKLFDCRVLTGSGRVDFWSRNVDCWLWSY